MGQAGAGDLFLQLVQPLARLQHVKEDGEGAQFHRPGAQARHVVGHARDLPDDDPDVLRPLRDLLVDVQQLLDGDGVADVVQHRRDVVQAIGVREDLGPGGVLRFLLKAAVQVADLDVGAGDLLALDVQHHAHGAVHGRVRRAHVQGHRLGRQVGRVGFQIARVLDPHHDAAA